MFIDVVPAGEQEASILLYLEDRKLRLQDARNLYHLLGEAILEATKERAR